MSVGTTVPAEQCIWSARKRAAAKKKPAQAGPAAPAGDTAA